MSKKMRYSAPVTADDCGVLAESMICDSALVGTADWEEGNDLTFDF